jgi:hypothetical protein
MRSALKAVPLKFVATRPLMTCSNLQRWFPARLPCQAGIFYPHIADKAGFATAHRKRVW